MEKRYQVFVSSTYADLQDERQEVMQALLELDCIPAGMELFPAANEDQWSLIKRVIEDCDYYIVIIAGRYGSIGPEGRSYTEMEYKYAFENGKPIIAFLHKNPGSLPFDRCEQSSEGKVKLEELRQLVQQKMCRFWDSPAELGSQVSRSLVKLIKNNPAVGWVRGDLVPDESATEEMLRLMKRIEELEAKLRTGREKAPEGTEALAQGEDSFEIKYSFKAAPPKKMFNTTDYIHSIDLTWDAIFGEISPNMINEITEAGIEIALNNLIQVSAEKEIRQHEDFKESLLTRFEIRDEDFQTIKVQLKALGLIAKSQKTRSVKDTSTYWTLTPYGDTVMTRLRAIPHMSGKTETDLSIKVRDYPLRESFGINIEIPIGIKDTFIKKLLEKMSNDIVISTLKSDDNKSLFKISPRTSLEIESVKGKIEEIIDDYSKEIGKKINFQYS